MARPIKKGLDYFPLDVALNYKVQLIEAEYGLEGFAVIIKLYQEIYGSNGYYCQWNEDMVFLFARENGIDIDTLNMIVAAAIRREIFDKGMYEKFGILTSAGIQSRYMEVKRRDYSKLYYPYALIEIPSNFISAEKTGVLEEKTEVLECNNATKESKVNKIKENKNKGEESKVKESKKEKGIYAEKTPQFTPPTLYHIENCLKKQGVMFWCNKFISLLKLRIYALAVP